VAKGPLVLTRRALLLTGSAVVAAALLQRRSGVDARLSTRPAPPRLKVQPGEVALDFGGSRSGFLLVPKSYRPNVAAPLAVILHGAGGSARGVSSRFAAAEEFGVILLVPESRGGTWDGIRGGYGPDIEFLNRSLAFAFERCAVDARRLAIGGFSDGATYGLSVGLVNPELFTHVLACSPGFIIPGGGAPASTARRPQIFISHGTNDEILPINATSRRIVPELERASYAVTYREFDGPHTVPPAIAREAFAWFVGRSARGSGLGARGLGLSSPW
jgi:phospholipase/carboxylesterase